MTIHFDDKGKFYTDIISKEPITATIQTITHRIRGNVYVRQGERLIDELRSTGQFIAVTDAEVFDTNGETIYRSAFLTINRDNVIWVSPQENTVQTSADSGGRQ